MMGRHLVVCVVLVLAFGTVRAAPLDPALQAELLALYDAYTKAVLAGNLPKALSYHDRDTRQQLQKETKTRQQKQELIEMHRLTQPDAFDVQYADVSKGGHEATIFGVARKTWPAHLRGQHGIPPDGVTQAELTLQFRKEGGAWKYVSRTFGMDPEQITRCTNTAAEPAEAYDSDRTVSMGGRLVRVAFEADHTLLIVRLIDEEHCFYLPPQPTPQEAGFNPDRLKPWTIVEVDASPHKQDKLKALVEGIVVRE
jgi:hypothetical protein